MLGMNASALVDIARASKAAGSTTAAVLTSVEIFCAHLFLKMLFQTRLVGKFSKAIGAFERTIITAVRCLHVVVEEPFFCKIFAT